MADDGRRIDDEAIHRRFFESASQVLCVFDRDGRLICANPALTRALGWSAAEIATFTLLSLVHPDDAAATERAWLEALAGRPARAFANRVRTADGAYRWFEWTGIGVDEHGRCFASAADVTCARRVAAHAAEMERAARIGAWEFDVDGGEAYWSPALYAIFERDPGSGPPGVAEGVGYVAAEARPLVQRAVERLGASGEAFELTVPIVTDAGSRRWVAMTGRAEMPDGRVVRVYGAIRDVTEERAQREQLEQLSAVAAHTSNMVAIYDTEGRITWCNAALERRTGYRSAELIGRSADEMFVHPDADPRVRAARAAAIRDGKGLKFEVLCRARSGEAYWVEVDVQPVAGDGQRPRGFIAISTDITARKENEARLKTLEREAQLARQRLLAAVEVLDDGFAFYDSQDRLVLCNQRYRELYHESAAAMVPGATFEQILRYGLERGQYLAAIGREEEWLEERMRNHKAAGATVEQALPGGRWLRVTERITPDGGRVGLRFDITAIKQAERRLSDIIAGTNAGTWEWNIRTGEKVVNARWAEMLGYTLEELHPLDQWFWSRICHADDLPAAKAAFDAHLNGETGFYEAEVRLMGKDGRWRWIMDRGRVATHAPDGKPEWVSGTHQDISQQKEAEAGLRESEERFRTLFEVFPDGVTVLDPETLRFAAFNRVAPALLGYTAEEFTDMPVATIDLLDTVEERRERAARIAAGERQSFETRLRRRDGSVAPVAISLVPLPSGGRTLLLGVWRDITELKRQQDATEAARRAAEAASEAKSQFLATMSHEIRTPMNGVIGMADLLSRTVEDPRHRQMVETIKESGDALMRVLNDILDFSKIEAGRLDLERIAFPPADLARKVRSLHALKAADKNIGFVVETVGDPEAPRLGDPHRILQVLHNLVGNAIKFTTEGGVTIRIDCAAEETLSVTVADTGIGMSSEQAARVFDAFAQADSSTTRRFGGTGLGMAIVRRLTDMMGGALELNTAPAMGTTVRLVLPAPRAERADGFAEAAETAPRPGLRVLAAEHDVRDRATLTAMLEAAGARPLIVASGREAVAVAAAGDFDVLLLDLTTPDMDGRAALAAIRAQAAARGRRRVPAVALTSIAQSSEPPGGDFDARLARPLTVAALKAVLARLTSSAAAPA